MKKAWKLLAALPLLVCFLQAASSAVSEIPLPEKNHPGLEAILRNAVQQSPRMVNQALELEVAENDRITARANLLPSLSASYSYNVASDKTDSTQGYHNTVKTPYSVSLTQPLFHWGERRNNDRMGAIQQEIAKGSFREGYRLLAQEIRASYLRLIMQKITLKRSHFYQEYVNKQLKQQEERLVKKVISEVEISAFRLTAEQAQIALERTELEYDNAKRSLARLAGLGRIDDNSIPDTISVTTYAAGPVDQALSEFLTQKDPTSADAFALRQRITIADLTYANAKTRLRPKVNGVLALTQDEQTNFNAIAGNRYNVSSRYVGISVNWNIFDGFAAGAAKRNALIRRRQLENDYGQLTERLAQDAQTAAKQINFSARNVAIYDRLLTSNEGYLKAVREDFRRGIKSEADVSLVQINVYDSEWSAANARADLLIRNGDFLGVLNEDPIVANLPVK